jgi:hypothetical protein
MLLAMRARPNIDTVEPNRPKVRQLNDEPRVKKSKTEIPEPIAVMPKTESEDPHLMNVRQLKLLPINA